MTGTRTDPGGTRIANRGRTAPIENAAAEANAAYQGLTTSSSSIPSSVVRCAARASRSVNSPATASAVARCRPRASHSWVSSSSSATGSSSSSRRSFSMSERWLSFWLLTDTYSPSAIDMAPPTSAATPAVAIAGTEVEAPATPTTIEAVETMPSFAPVPPRV